jgi:hypothetical protein
MLLDAAIAESVRLAERLVLKAGCAQVRSARSLIILKFSTQRSIAMICNVDFRNAERGTIRTYE